MKKFFIGLVVVVIAGAITYFLGPRVKADETVRFDSAVIGTDPVSYLEQVEAKFSNIHDNLQKEIIWAYPQSRAKTPLAIVYIHGFSASKEEVRPLPDIVAKELGANLYFTRLSGHGQDGDGLASATVNDWINDFAEAMAIGRMIGENVIVLSTSTGGGLSTWAAGQKKLSADIAGLVLISPNYAFRHPLAGLATGPWGTQIAELAEGKIRSFKPTNEEHGRYWTSTYPTRSGIQMAALTEMAHGTPVEKIMIPALFIYSPADTVVDATVTAEVAKRWGGPSQSIIVKTADDPNNHVIVGRVLSPSNTDRLAAQTLEWIRKTVQ